MNRLTRVLTRGNARLSVSGASSLWAKSIICRPLGMTLSRSSPVPFSLSKRFITNSRPLSSSSSSSSLTSSEEQKEQKGLFGQWPYYPLVAMGLISAISKEVLILNDELVFVGTFLTFVTGMYIYVNQDVKNFFDSKQAHEITTLRECTGLAIDTAKRFITIEKRNLSFPEDIKNLYEEEKKMTHLTVDYQNKKHKLDVRDATLQKLSTIRSMETEESSEYKKLLQDYTLAYVLEKYSQVSKSERDSHIDQLIDNIPTSRGTAIYEDLINGYVREFLSQNYSPSDLGVSSRVPSFLAKENETATKAKH